MFFVLDVQVLECGDEGLGLEAPGTSYRHWCWADGALAADGDSVAPPWGAQRAGPVQSLGHTAHTKAPTEVNTVQHLCNR